MKKTDKFVLLNVLAALAMFSYLYLTEPVIGILVIGSIGVLIGAIAIVLLILSKMLDKSSFQGHVLKKCLRQYIVYLWVAWFGWTTHKNYIESEEKHLMITFIVISILIASLSYIVISYNLNKNALADKDNS